MRFLIICTALACALAAPSGPTSSYIDPDDAEAGAIDAEVKFDDKSRLDTERTNQYEYEEEMKKERATEKADLDKEMKEETYWSTEEKKWQALETVNTAKAKLEGAEAGSSPSQASLFYHGYFVPQSLHLVPKGAQLNQIASNPAPVAPIASPVVRQFTYQPIYYSPVPRLSPIAPIVPQISPFAPISPIGSPIFYTPIVAKTEAKKDEANADENEKFTKSAEEKREKPKKRIENDKVKARDGVRTADPAKSDEIKPLPLTTVFITPEYKPALTPITYILPGQVAPFQQPTLFTTPWIKK